MKLRQAKKILDRHEGKWTYKPCACPWKKGTLRQAIRKVYWNMKKHGIPWGWAMLGSDSDR